MPGLLADSLPDRFGNQLIDTWLATQGRAPADFSPVERLCYIANRGMGALEFEPALSGGAAAGSQPVEIAALVELAQEVLDQREGFRVNLRDEDTEGLAGLLAVGTSAGGARPKALISFNETTSDVRSGQVTAPAGYGYWLLKLDGVRDQALADCRSAWVRLTGACWPRSRACHLRPPSCARSSGRCPQMLPQHESGPPQLALLLGKLLPASAAQ